MNRNNYIGLKITGAVIGLGGVLMILNPSMEDYANFSTRSSLTHFQEEVCQKKIPLIPDRFEEECLRVTQSPEVKEKVRQLMIKSSIRQNYLFFSLYTTNVDIADLMPNIVLNLMPGYQAQGLSMLLDIFPNYQTQSIGYAKLFYTFKPKPSPSKKGNETQNNLDSGDAAA